MSELFEKSIRTLELPAVLELLARHAVSDEAKARCLRLRPATDAAAVEHLLDETDAAKTRLGLHGSPSFAGVKDVSQALDRADHGGVLNTRELLDVAGVLTAARRVSDYDAERQGEATAIDRLFSALHVNRYLEDKIRGAILDEETIADTASPELADIRRNMRAAASKGRQILQRIISSPSYAKVLQEALITQRDGRFVVPVKAECKGSLPGLVHDISSSGATLFVEPMGVVQANNELKELQAREEKEIDRVLRILSGECAAQRENILYDYDLLVQLDTIFARAQLSYAMDAGRPLVRTRGGIDLKRARHPLLDPAKAVPVTVALGGAYDTLVITGPNTGGKTVTLKTLGLLCLMAQCGLHIPAGDQSAVQVFDRVLADVGDEQSIEQSLSTFSAHMANTVEILKLADEKSLILFDELGAGTDPVEGAALAIAIIQDVRRKGALTAATTHYAELKTFAMTTAGVENASCEFDVQTLRPTYRLLIGIPGKSNAFAISRRLGLDESVISHAVGMQPERIVYVSCDPGTLARDLASFARQGYTPAAGVAVDMFPRTSHVETVCLLVLRNPVTHINIDVDVEEMVQDKRGLATYEQIKDYVLEHSGLKVSSLYIAQVKQKCGIIERENYNKPKSENAKQPQCPPEKERAITEALKHFGMI